MDGDDLDAVYRERNACVAAIATMAVQRGWDAFLAADDQEPGWHVVFLETPRGQLSWHVPERDLSLFSDLRVSDRPSRMSWDGHTTPEKYQRLLDLMRLPI